MVSGTTGAELRRSLVNARDLGGLPTVGGGQTRSGVLCRSDAPYVGDDAPGGIAWPPTAVVDLREASEYAAVGYPWPESVTHNNIPLFMGARIDRMTERKVDDVYATILRDAPHRVTIALNAFDPDGLTLVHCAAGKDRTGVVIAAALTLAGVVPDVVVDDYAKTEDAIADVHARMSERRRVPRNLALDHQIFRSPRAAISAVVTSIADQPGGAWGWFESHGGDVEHFRRWVAHYAG